MKIKVGIIEDELGEAKALSKLLINLGYDVSTPSHDYDEAFEMIKNEEPDLLLLDIDLQGNLDGIEVANLLRNFYTMPYIFHTSNINPELMERAKQVNPSAYLTKPATKDQLHAAIEIAITNQTKQINKSRNEGVMHNGFARCVHDYVYVYDGQTYRKVCFAELLYIKSEANYVGLHFANGNSLLVRSTLSEFSLQLDKKQFVRIHRCYIANVQNIDKVSGFEIVIRDKSIPLSKVYKSDLFKVLGIAGKKNV